MKQDVVIDEAASICMLCIWYTLKEVIIRQKDWLW